MVPRMASQAAERFDTQVFRAIPPTQLVDRSYSAYIENAARPSRIPPTQLVDRSYSAYVRSPQKSLQQRRRQLSARSDVGRWLP